ncbi:HD domain-containing protein [Pullulanibacillus sp. KACC 23026]|uniref:HD-GYP domain-containing protein n=1 Tax=Pullulanibacillus sp. KACC 23026 TaxID=3028315 RepID=UPI0023B0B198|nr:HD domain-containing phosphohydrolase [Pullulanibacillus sp. KACC 23026]WEG13194.1 HD domain-containing protein [Pullulanibacillus sp. KACC 23026]
MSERHVFLLDQHEQLENDALVDVASFSHNVSKLTGLPQSILIEFIETLPLYKEKTDSHTKSQLLELFNETIDTLSQDGRLGAILQDSEALQFVQTRFCQFLSDDSVFQLLQHLKEWDDYSYYHSVDVFLLGTLLGRQLGVKNLSSFSLGCLLHDIGKRLLPCVILSKQSKLTESEFITVQKHTSLGYALLKLLQFPDEIRHLALLHHERLNASGYPLSLTEEDLSEEWRIISVVDVYSALTLKRTYRDPLSPSRALEIILNDRDKLCASCTYRLADLLQLFPPQAELFLTNGTRAKTVLHNEKERAHLQLQIRETGQITSIAAYKGQPMKMVGWKSHRLEQWKKQLWSSFIDSLIHLHPNALAYFEELADGKRVETIYLSILGRAAIEIRQRFLKGELTETDFSNATQAGFDIMNQKTVEYAPSYQATFNLGIVFLSLQELHAFPLRLLHDVLFVNSWQTYFLRNGLDMDGRLEDCLSTILKKDYVEYLTLAHINPQDVCQINKVIQLVRRLNPAIKILLYSRPDNLYEGVDTSSISFIGHELNHFLSYFKIEN